MVKIQDTRRLSQTQRKQWERTGYLHVKGALLPDQVSFFSREIDRIRQLPGYEPSPEGPLGHYAWLDQTVDRDPNGFMARRDLLQYGDAFIDLIDKAPIFDLVVDIMGPNILFTMSQANVRPSTNKFAGYIHTDGGEAMKHIRVSDSSRPLSVKVMYLLTDVTARLSGNLTVFPGSHRRPFPTDAAELINPLTPGAVPLLGSAGDAYLFSHALWHGPSPNRSGRVRKALLYNYSQMFMRFYDYRSVPEVVKRATPRQRRLLGDLGYDFRPGSYYYVPEDQEEIIMGGRSQHE